HVVKPDHGFPLVFPLWPPSNDLRFSGGPHALPGHDEMFAGPSAATAGWAATRPQRCSTALFWYENAALNTSSMFTSSPIVAPPLIFSCRTCSVCNNSCV